MTESTDTASFADCTDQDLIDCAHAVLGERAIATEDFSVLATLAVSAIVAHDPDWDGEPGEYGAGNLEFSILMNLLKELKARAAR